MDNIARIAVIGCGRIAGHHCRSIASIPGAALVAVCDLFEDKAATYGREFSVPYYTNYHEMLTNHHEANVVALMTPSGMHFEHALDVMGSYKRSVIVEKPTFMRLSQIDEAYSLASRLGVQIFPVFQNRHNLAVQRVKQALTDGELGAVRIASVRVRWCRPQRYYEMAPWRGTYSHDGGALTNQGVHHIDLLRYFCGEVSRVNASMRTMGVNIEVEDSVVGTFELTSGALGNLEITTAARPLDFEASLSLVCENGLAQLGGIAVNELQVFTPEPSACAAYSEDFKGNVYGAGHLKIYRDLVASLRSGSPFTVTRQDCLGTIGLIHTFYRSDEARGWAEVSLKQESVRLGRPNAEISAIYRTPERSRGSHAR